jgi:hypothetical protein
MPNLTAPVPQQTATDFIAPGNLSKAATRLLGLRDNPQRVLHPPAAPPFNAGDDLHAADRLLIFATLQKAPLQSGGQARAG